MEWYLKNWQFLRGIVAREYFNKPASHVDIRKAVNDIAFFQQIEECERFFKPLSVALDKLQCDNCGVADAVEAWKSLLQHYRTAEYRDILQKAEERYNMSVPTAWLAANIMHPAFLGQNLTQQEWKTAKNWIATTYPDSLGAFINFIGGENDKIKTEYSLVQGKERLKLLNFMKAQAVCGNLDTGLLQLSLVLFSLVPSSAGIERIFSTMGHVQTDLRNRLNPEKVKKLAFRNRLLEK